MADASHDLPPLRFTLAGLFELIAGLAVFLALVTQLDGFGLGAGFLGVLVLVVADLLILAKHRGHSRLGIVGCLGAIIFLLLAIALLLPAVSVAREAARRTQCRNNLKQIIVAIHNYHDIHGHLPPPYVADANGQPMHSWRVLVLPYMEHQALYNAYSMNEPWNGPNNSKLAAKMPNAYRCPSDAALPLGMTSYFYVTGAGRSNGGQANLTFDDIRDGTANTLGVVESCSARVNWLDPRDLTVEDILAGKNTAASPCACSHHGRSESGMWRSSGGFIAAMLDGSVQYFPHVTDAAWLRPFLTIDGGEPLDAYDVQGADDTHLWPGTWVLLAAEALFLIFAITRRVLLARRTPYHLSPAGSPHG